MITLTASILLTLILAFSIIRVSKQKSIHSYYQFIFSAISSVIFALIELVQNPKPFYYTTLVLTMVLSMILEKEFRLLVLKNVKLRK